MDNIEAKQWETDRRNMRRLVFSASAEVTDAARGITLDARMTDIGTGGCFLDTIFPFSVGSRVRVTVRNGLIQFQADGRVVYSQERVGMGVAFDELNRHQRMALVVLV